MTIYFRTVVALLCLAASTATAQDLAAHLEALSRHNPEVRSAQMASQAQDADFAGAWGALLPSLTAAGGWTHNEYDAVIKVPTAADPNRSVTIVPRDQLDLSLRAEVPLLNVGRWSAIAAGAAASRAAAARAELSHDSLRRQLVQSYYLLAGANAVAGAAERSLTVAQAQLEFQAARAAAGVSTELERLRALAEVERSRQALTDAQTAVLLTTRAVESLSGLHVEVHPALPSDNLAEEAPLSAWNARVDSIPQVRAATADSDSSRARLWGAATAWVPSVSAQFTQRFTNATGFQGAATLYNAGVNLNWKFDLPTIHTIRAANAGDSQTIAAAESARTKAIDQLYTDWNRTRAAIEKVRSVETQLTASTAAAHLAHDRYAAGVATQLDVIQADRDVFVTEVSHIQARADLAASRIFLRLSAGLPWDGQP